MNESREHHGLLIALCLAIILSALGLVAYTDSRKSKRVAELEKMRSELSKVVAQADALVNVHHDYPGITPGAWGAGIEAPAESTSSWTSQVSDTQLQSMSEKDRKRVLSARAIEAEIRKMEEMREKLKEVEVELRTIDRPLLFFK